MTRRANAKMSAVGRGFRVFIYLLTLVMGVVGFLYAYSTVEDFLIRDSRFIVQGPPEPGLASDFFRVEGAVHASEQQIAGTFQRDFGRSIYLCPIQERRRKLLAIDWVKDATVSRFWPNRIVVRVTERSPVAFVQRSGAGGMLMYGLIDDEGVLMDPQRTSKLPLPVIVGIPPEDTEATRRERVKRF